MRGAMARSRVRGSGRPCPSRSQVHRKGKTLTTDVRASDARVPTLDGPSSREMSPGEVPSSEVVRAVQDMYRRHPFPPAQRKHSYQRHAAYVRSFLAERGIDPRGRTFGDIACGTGLMMLDYAREFPETSFIGLDLSETSVGMVNQTLDQESVGNARAYQQDIMLLDRAKDLDYIVSGGSVSGKPATCQTRPRESRSCARPLSPGESCALACTATTETGSAGSSRRSSGPSLPTRWQMTRPGSRQCGGGRKATATSRTTTPLRQWT